MGATWSESIALPDPSFLYATDPTFRQKSAEILCKEGGLGIVLVSWEGESRHFINKIEEYGAVASTGKVDVWDELVSINGKDVQGLSDCELSGLARGPTGTEVTIGLRRGTNNDEFTLSLERRSRDSRIIDFARLFSEPRVGADFREVPIYLRTGAGRPDSTGASTGRTYGERTYLIL